MNESSPLLQVKGIRDGILISFAQAPWIELEEALFEQIEGQVNFFHGARISLDVGPTILRVAELSALRDKLSEHGIGLWAVISESPLTEATAQNLGLATRFSTPRGTESKPEGNEIPAEAAKWVKGPLRSGARVIHDGAVVVLGDINPGAEVVAGGSVIVWGRLRGVVHAGASGDEGVVVCALELSPTQLRIAGEIAISPQKSGKKMPEVACLRDGKLIAEPWHEEKDN